MSTTKIITMVCWIIVAVVMIGLVIWFLTGSLFGIPTGFRLPFSIGTNIELLTGPYKEVGTYEVENSEIGAIAISWISGGVDIKPYDGNTIQLHEFAQRDLKENETLRYEVSGGKLSIHYQQNNTVVNMPSKKLEIDVPAALAKSLSELSATCTSADFTLSHFKVGTLTISETSGSTSLSDTEATAIKINSVSGSVELTSVKTENLSAGTVSGAVNMRDVSAGSLTGKTTSGAQNLKGSFGEVNLNSVSGGIALESSQTPTSLTAGTTSGSISVSVPKSDRLSVSYSSVSGMFSSDFPVLLDSGAPQFSFHTVSGGMRVHELKAS